MYLCYGCQDLKEKGQDSGWKSWICYVGPGQGGKDHCDLGLLPFYLKLSLTGFLCLTHKGYKEE